MADNQSNDALARRTLFNTLGNISVKLINLAAWLFLTRFTLQHLGPNLFGLWVLVASVTAYGLLFDFGIATAITKYVAEFRARQEPERARALIATALWLYTGLGLAVALIGAAMAPVFPDLFGITPEQRATAVWLVLLSGLSVGLSIPASTPFAVLRGLQRFDVINLLSVVGTLMSVAATVASLYAGGGVIGVVMVGILVTIVMQVAAIRCIQRLAPDMPLGWRGAEARLVRTVATFSSWLFLIHLGGQLETKSDEIVIGKFLPLSSVTPYTIARRVSALPLSLTEQFLSLLLPLAASMHAGNDRARIRSLYIISTRLALAMFMPIGLSLVVLAKPILTLWVGEAYSAHSHLVFILVLAGLIDVSLWPGGLIAQGMARHKPVALFALATGFSNLAISIVLIQRLGLTGVALGTLIPTTAFCLLFVTPYYLRILDVSPQELISRGYLPALAPAIPAIVVAYALRELLAPQSLAAVGLVAGSSGLVFVASYLSLKVNEFERRLCRHFLRTLMEFARLKWQRAWL